MEHSTNTPEETEEDEVLEDLPSLPQVIPEILALQDGDPIDRLIELIEQDAPLAIKVLSTCNSPALGLRREVTTVGDAVVGLGLRAVRSLAICTAVVEAVADRNGGLSEVAQAHKAALRRAGTARALAHAAKVSTPQEAFTAGLLADIGRFWLARRHPDGQEACRTLIGSGEDPVEVERELFGEDHIELGVRVAEGWNLPERLKRVIRLHHQEENCTEVLEQIVHLSDLAATLQESAIQESGDQRRLRDLAWTWFGLESKQLEGWLEQAGRDAKDAADALDLPAPAPPVRKVSELCRELGAMYVDNERMVRELRASVRQAQQYSSQLKQQMAKLDVMATTDDLTGIGNRRAIRERLDQEMIHATEENQTAILLIDLDKFKHINDTYGHEGGDQALKSLSRFLQRVTRGSDFVGRYGGDEFIVILPGADCVGAQVVAERIRKVVADTKVPLRDGRKLQMQVSIGGCTLPISDTEEEAAIALVDRALYAAKRLGRNQVVWVGAEDGSTPAVKPPERSRRKWEPPRKRRPTNAA